MPRHFDLEEALQSSGGKSTAPPAWTNAEVALVNDLVVLHAGGGRLQGQWHRQDSDECLVVLRGELRVEFGDETVRVDPGEGVLIRAHEPHRTEVPEHALLLSVESREMRRLAP